jgi:hypothetical protein
MTMTMHMSGPRPVVHLELPHARQLGASVLAAPCEGRPDGAVSFRRHHAVSSLSGRQHDDQRTQRGTRAARALTASERELLWAAQRGDDDAFGRLAGAYRGEL